MKTGVAPYNAKAMKTDIDSFRAKSSKAKGLRLPVFLFYGEEPFFVAEGVDLVRAVFKSVAGPEAAVAVYPAATFLPPKAKRKADSETATASKANSAALAPILDELRTEDFFQTQRLTVVTGAGELMREFADTLLRYLDAPGQGATLALCVDSKTPPPPRKLTARIEAIGAVVECKKIYENKLPAWLTRRAKADGYKLTQGVAKRLFELVGADLFKLAGELSKLYLYAQGRDTISTGDIDAVVAPTRDFAAYQLTDAVLDKRHGEALRIAAKLMEGGDDKGANLILVVLGRSLRILWRVVRDPSTNAAAVGLHPFALKQLQKHHRRYHEADFRRINQMLLDTDRAMKTTGLPSRIAVESLLVSLMGI